MAAATSRVAPQANDNTIRNIGVSGFLIVATVIIADSLFSSDHIAAGQHTPPHGKGHGHPGGLALMQAGRAGPVATARHGVPLMRGAGVSAVQQTRTGGVQPKPRSETSKGARMDYMKSSAQAIERKIQTANDGDDVAALESKLAHNEELSRQLDDLYEQAPAKSNSRKQRAQQEKMVVKAQRQVNQSIGEIKAKLRSLRNAKSMGLPTNAPGCFGPGCPTHTTKDSTTTSTGAPDTSTSDPDTSTSDPDTSTSVAPPPPSTSLTSGTGPSPTSGTDPSPTSGTNPSSTSDTGPSPTSGTGPSPTSDTDPSPTSGTNPLSTSAVVPDTSTSAAVTTTTVTVVPHNHNNNNATVLHQTSSGWKNWIWGGLAGIGAAVLVFAGYKCGCCSCFAKCCSKKKADAINVGQADGGYGAVQQRKVGLERARELVQTKEGDSATLTEHRRELDQLLTICAEIDGEDLKLQELQGAVAGLKAQASEVDGPSADLVNDIARLDEAIDVLESGLGDPVKIRESIVVLTLSVAEKVEKMERGGEEELAKSRARLAVAEVGAFHDGGRGDELEEDSGVLHGYTTRGESKSMSPLGDRKVREELAVFAAARAESDGNYEHEMLEHPFLVGKKPVHLQVEGGDFSPMAATSAASPSPRRQEVKEQQPLIGSLQEFSRARQDATRAINEVRKILRRYQREVSTAARNKLEHEWLSQVQHQFQSSDQQRRHVNLGSSTIEQLIGRHATQSVDDEKRARMITDSIEHMDNLEKIVGMMQRSSVVLNRLDRGSGNEIVELSEGYRMLVEEFSKAEKLFDTEYSRMKRGFQSRYSKAAQEFGEHMALHSRLLGEKQEKVLAAERKYNSAEERLRRARDHGVNFSASMTGAGSAKYEAAAGMFRHQAGQARNLLDEL